MRAFLLALIAVVRADECNNLASWCPMKAGSHSTRNVTELLQIAQATMNVAFNGIFSTLAVGDRMDINTRVMSPKPVTNITGDDSLAVVFIDSNCLSRKNAEIKDAIRKRGAARANLLYYDRDGNGYIALRGNATMCDAAEARREWWDGWIPFYPQKANTSTYCLIRFEPDVVEISVGTTVQSGRADWLPVTLERIHGTWQVEVAPAPPAPPAPSGWKCSWCAHVYDPDKDGGGLPFEELPDDFKCPICNAPKSAFKKTTLDDGQEHWVHEELV